MLQFMRHELLFRSNKRSSLVVITTKFQNIKDKQKILNVSGEKNTWSNENNKFGNSVTRYHMIMAGKYHCLN